MMEIFVHRIGVGQQLGHQRVTGLVVGDALLLLLTHHPRLALGAARHDAIDGILQVLHVDLFLAPAGRQQRGLVHQVLQVGAGEAGRAPRQ